MIAKGPRRRRWLWLIPLVAIVLAATAVAALPWWLGTGPGRRWVVARANRALAPGRLELQGLKVSWFGPAQLRGVTIRDREGDAVVAAPEATWDRTLGQFLSDRPRLGTLTLRGAKLDVERRPDGSIDLAEAIAPLFTGNPAGDLTLVVDRGRFRLRAPALAEPVEAVAFDLTVKLPPSPRPFSWEARLADPGRGTLSVTGSYRRWDDDPRGRPFRVTLACPAAPWPITLDLGGTAVRLGFHGQVTAERAAGVVTLAGDASLRDDVIRSGKTERRIDRLDLSWKARRVGDSWEVASVAAATPWARVEGRGSLARTGDATGIKGQFRVEEIAWPDAGHPAVRGPIDVALEGSAGRDAAVIDRLEITGNDVTVRASGRLDGPEGARRIDVAGTITPDAEKLRKAVADRVDPEATLDVKAGHFHVRGPIAGDLDVEGRLNIAGARFYGMELGPAEVVATGANGTVELRPIETTLNGGTLRVEPTVRKAESGDWVLSLGPGTALDGAEVNDEVSRRVLSFAAPVLQQATRVHGRVSAGVDRAEIPLASDARNKAVVEGRVVFRDVEFAPGPLGADLLDLLGRDPSATLRLDRPVVLSIADGKVRQRGLAIPIANLTEVELEGTVDFDRNLAMTATVPVTPAMLGNNRVLSGIAAGTRMSVPIGGTLSKPKLDREAFRAALKDVGKELLTRGAVVGVGELLDRLTRPRDPNAPPPPPRLTPEERRARRLERKAQRQAERQRKRQP
ncbi:MAG TPA: hypothetical protein VG406_28350 [Isosphaeraceae bacterium]|jgi:hypothetical protein|nr:hypothetical protein [Isosphaeraceae bacterium]